MPRLTLAVALLLLVAVASTMTYAIFLVVGVLADYLGTGRFLAGLLLGILFARFPSISKGKFRTVGLLPPPVRRPIMVVLLGLCMLHFLTLGDYVPVLFIGLATAFLLTFPWMRQALFGRLKSAFSTFMGRQASTKTVDHTVIDGEFRERKD